jgi:hypothetical protein
VDTKPLGEVPGVGDREMLAALRDLASIPATADVADRFAFEVRGIVEDRAQTNWNGERSSSDVAVFLHTPYPRKVGSKLGATPVTNLIASGAPILGKLFLLNQDASYGYAIDFPTEPDGIINWLIDGDLGDQPVVFAYRGSKRLLARAKGAKGEITRRDMVRDKPPAATLEEVEEAMTFIHGEHLISPSVCPDGVWAKGRSAKYIPGPYPERAIQRFLKPNLNSWFRGVVRATAEEPTAVGRIDIRLSELRQGIWVIWAILELKVVRSSHNAARGRKVNPVSHADNVDAVAEGVRQVNAYAKTWKAEPLLEIFDLRKVKTPDVLGEATVKTELSKCMPVPLCRSWPLFGSAADARLAGYPQGR